MDGKMMLSRRALYYGFHDETDQKNVAIHEFIHLIDKQDGDVDGILEEVMEDMDITPWLELIHQKTSEIQQKNSTIREYGISNRAEFLAVAGEFFFESPDKMKTEHPLLYKVLDRIFNPRKRTPLNDYQFSKATRMNEPCPCGSGKKFKRCCYRNERGYAK